MIRIICLGKIKEKYLKDALDDYLQRLTNYHKVEIVELKDDDNIKNEEMQMEKYLNDKAYKIAMDIKGIPTSSEELSSLIDNKLMQYANIYFFIGASNGLSDKIKENCHLKMSFGPITMPHGLFRLIMVEQIYRCFKILSNERYHK